MSWTAPRTWVAGEIVTAALMNTHIRDNETLLKTYINNDGTFNLASATATGGQVAFPATQNASANANTLDDYEEGSWTPSIGGSTSQSGQAYSLQVGKYVKIGRMVFVQGAVTLSTLGTITGNVQIKGLPFTSEGTGNNNGSVVFSFVSTLAAATFSSLGGFIPPTDTVITLEGFKGAATSTSALAQADLANTSSFTFTASYMASA